MRLLKHKVERLESFSKPRSEPSTLPHAFPQVSRLRGRLSRLGRSATQGSSAPWDVARAWAGESCCPQELGRAGRSSRTPQLISPMPEGTFLVSPWGISIFFPPSMQNTTAALQVVPLFIPSLRELHLQVRFGPGDAGGYLQPQSDVREAQGVRPSWRFPCRELRPTAWDGSTARVWELPAEGDGQPAARAARLLQIGQVGLATCNSYSSGFSVPPDSRGAPTPLTLAFLAVYLHCS